MATPPLTIRNLTSTPLELVLLERFAPVSESITTFTKLTRTLSGLTNFSTPATPTSVQLAQKSTSFTNTTLSLDIAPFTTQVTDIDTPPDETLRLTFLASGQRYRLTLPAPTSRSTTLVPLSPSPAHEFTSVYLLAYSHLSIYSSANLQSWMSHIPSALPLSALSIPGTHNSPTYRKALPSVRCQSVSVKTQLENGIRFLDIRVQPENAYDASKEGLVLVHSAFPVALTGTKYFRQLVDTVLSFLEENPTETVIMSIKREGIGRATDQHLSLVLKEHYANDTTRWFTENRIPTLGEARSKIILLRRFAIDESLKAENNGRGWAVDAESWPDNTADGLCSSGEIRVQDFYEVAVHTNITKKIGFCEDHLGRAGRVIYPQHSQSRAENENGRGREKGKEVPDPIFMNFLSASNFWRANCWPERVAEKVNPSILEFLCRRHNEAAIHAEGEKREVGDGSTGVVVCDWVGLNGDWDLVRCVVGMNARLEMR
ncbi:hypothetical protein HYFRA_00010420 [Hymenoscyphus fraxineus]|uniref:Phosphatidylinositol-specific phospholipase C X domain-containing protein n=1 Tax=Hymenoscyphus fraxineus TaxID=746836 RepID=A0A9N9L150_9HELO|nr:hypothetical protein HYFRA_00010420 [Hymenoscyphus fraxineus]